LYRLSESLSSCLIATVSLFLPLNYKPILLDSCSISAMLAVLGCRPPLIQGLALVYVSGGRLPVVHPIPSSLAPAQTPLLDAPYNRRLPSASPFSHPTILPRLPVLALGCSLVHSFAEVFRSSALKSASSAPFARHHRGGGALCLPSHPPMQRAECGHP